jgi:hypothetical protein
MSPLFVYMPTALVSSLVAGDFDADGRIDYAAFDSGSGSFNVVLNR